PWLPPVPACLTRTPQWQAYLTARGDLIADLASQTRAAAREWTPSTAPRWAAAYLGNRALLADLAVWRAARAIDDDDLRPAGPKPDSVADRRLHQTLTARTTYTADGTRQGTARWAAALEALGAHAV